MRDFFHGWRRKVGLITLILACVLAGLWVRSLVLDEIWEFNIAGRAHLIRPHRGLIEWQSCLLDHERIQRNLLSTNGRARLFTSDYCSHLVLPADLASLSLTLLSLYLILWKPRKIAPNVETEETPHA